MPLTVQGSASLNPLAKTEVLIILPSEIAEIEQGVLVDVIDIWR